LSSYAFWTACVQALLGSIMCFGVFISFRIIRFPDLTCDGTFPLGACITASLITIGINPFLVTLIAIFSGFISGWITGILNVKFKIPGIVASILVMTALYSVNLLITSNPVISIGKNKTIFTIMYDFFIKKISGSYFFVNNDIFYSIILLAIVIIIKLLLDYFLHTEYGIAMQSAGDKPKSAIAQAVNVDFLICVGIAIGNGLNALGGSLYAQIQKFADVNMGVGMIIVGLASVYIGEALEKKFYTEKNLFFATLAVIIGSFLYKFAIAIALEMGLSHDYFNLITAIIVTIALLIPSVKNDIHQVIKKGYS